MALPISLGLAVLAPEFVRIVFGDQWEPTIPLLQILAMFGMFRMSYNNAAAFLHARGRVIGLVASQAVYGLMVVAGSTWAIARWGLEGVAWAVGCAILVMWLLVITLSSRASALRLTELLPLLARSAVPGLSLGLLTLCVASALRAFSVHPVVVLTLSGGVLGLCTAGALYKQCRGLGHPAINHHLDRVLLTLKA